MPESANLALFVVEEVTWLLLEPGAGRLVPTTGKLEEGWEEFWT